MRAYIYGFVMLLVLLPLSAYSVRAQEAAPSATPAASPVPAAHTPPTEESGDGPQILTTDLIQKQKVSEDRLQASFVIVSDLKVVKVTVNGKPVKINPGDTLVVQQEFGFEQPETIISITATDAEGRSRTKNYMVLYAPPPGLSRGTRMGWGLGVGAFFTAYSYMQAQQVAKANQRQHDTLSNNPKAVTQAQHDQVAADSKKDKQAYQMSLLSGLIAAAAYGYTLSVYMEAPAAVSPPVTVLPLTDGQNWALAASYSW